MDDYIIPKSKVLEGIKTALENSRDLIHEAITLTENFAISFHVLGMYTFALEEYGKALILEDALKNAKNDCKIPKDIFYKHPKKFDRALSELPYKCKNIFVQTESFVNSSEKPKTIKSKDGTEHELGPGHALVITEPILANFESRLSCFYLEWDSEMKQWEKPPNPEFTDLEETLSEFFNILLSKLDSLENDSKK